jgi:hypothetical protein
MMPLPSKPAVPRPRCLWAEDIRALVPGALKRSENSGSEAVMMKSTVMSGITSFLSLSQEIISSVNREKSKKILKFETDMGLLPFL